MKRCATYNVYSSQEWLRRQRDDPYVKQAHSQGLRSRAAFKLLEVC
jgi:23S rRNA (uridine2552-2'-O)-methyltransferase